MALFEPAEYTGKTFKEFAEEDVENVFFCESEFAQAHTIDGKEMLVVMEEDGVKPHSAHWEAGAKQNFDTGLYSAAVTMYVKVEDYGPKPKSGKQMVMDDGTSRRRAFIILECQEEAGVYRMKLGRTRQ